MRIVRKIGVVNDTIALVRDCWLMLGLSLTILIDYYGVDSIYNLLIRLIEEDSPE